MFQLTTVKMKECEKIEKYLDLSWELKKTVTVIPIIVGTVGMVPKRLEELRIRGRIATIHTIALR